MLRCSPTAEIGVDGLDLAMQVVELPLLEEDGIVRQRLPAALLEDRHQPVAVQALDHERTAGPEHSEVLAERLPVALLPAVADRREQAEHRVEALGIERQVAEVRLHPPRPFDVAGDPPRLRQLHLRAVDADDVKAELRER